MNGNIFINISPESKEQDGNRVKQTTVKLSSFLEFVEVFSDLVCAAQECIRKLYLPLTKPISNSNLSLYPGIRKICGGERSAASLRDVSRCVKVFNWFAHYFCNSKGTDESI
jgi:hypothetical protein